jgi:hypothetical protein
VRFLELEYMYVRVITSEILKMRVCVRESDLQVRFFGMRVCVRESDYK